VDDAVGSRRVPWALAAWVAAVALALVLLAAGAPPFFDELRTSCDPASGACGGFQPSPALVRALEERDLSLRFYAGFRVTSEVAYVLGFCAIATILVRRGAGEPMALLGAITLVTVGSMFTSSQYALVEAAPAWRWPVALMGLLGSVFLVVFFYRFPDGRFVPRWTRHAAIAWAAWCVAGYLTPTSWPINQDPDGGSIFPVLAVPFVGSALGAQVWRYRRVSTPVQRQQAKWVVCGLAAAFAGVFADAFLGELPLFDPESEPLAFLLLNAVSFHGALLLIPLSIGIAILRYRLFDIDALISRALVYGALTIGVTGFYVAVVGYLGTLVQAEGDTGHLLISLVATGVIAMLFQPVRAWLQRGVNRLLYGDRDDPYAVLSQLGRRLAGTLAPEDALQRVLETVASALKLPHAAIWLVDGDTLHLAAVHGNAPARETVRDGVAIAALRDAPGGLGTATFDPRGAFRAALTETGLALALPLSHHGELAGALCLAPRGPGEAFSAADRRLLANIAGHAGAAAQAVRLTAALHASLADLRQSRERLVVAQEDERRRIQRDLHDDLGPTLASIRMRLEGCLQEAQAVAPRLAPELERLDALVGQATADLRRLVYDLRPPTLNQLGLVPALRQHVERFGRDTGLTVHLSSAPDLAVPAATEVTVFRVVQEALVNVRKHARAARVEVRLTREGDWLALAIADDGCGLAPAGPNAETGTGLGSMRERAELLGGTLAVTSRPGGGTVVLLRVPAAEQGEMRR
jgi:signal transduction histidine kinase